MLSQEFQIMEGHIDDYWSIGNSAIDIKALIPEGVMNPVANESQDFISIGAGSGRGGFCLRTEDMESPAAEWTTVELICFGNKSLHIVNGQVVMILQNPRFVADGQSTPVTKGKIQLQSEAAEVLYEDVQLMALEKLPEAYAALF